MSRRFVELENIIDFVLVDFTGTCCEAIPKLSKVGVIQRNQGIIGNQNLDIFHTSPPPRPALYFHLVC